SSSNSRCATGSARNSTQLNCEPASLSVKYLCPELCARRLVTSPVTQIVPTCPSRNRRTCAVSSDTDKIFRTGAAGATGATGTSCEAVGAGRAGPVDATGNNSPLKSHCDFDCL